MQFEAYGPFKAPRTHGLIDRSKSATFWRAVNEKAKFPLSGANGVYIFSTLHGRVYTPWYVGMTCSEKGFRGEVFQDHKLTHYDHGLATKAGVPYFHLIARYTEFGEEPSGPSRAARREIDMLETSLIAMAWGVNRDLRNDKKTWFYKNCHIPGVMGEPSPGARSKSAQTLRRVIGIDW